MQFTDTTTVTKAASKEAVPITEAATTEGRTASVGAVRFAAMSLLAQREHSMLELTQKLSRRFDDLSLVNTVVQNLADEALQSDDRFTEAFVSMRKRRGQGPLRIANELKLKGISESLIHEYVDQTPHEEWLEIARDLCRRKYGDLDHQPDNLSDDCENDYASLAVTSVESAGSSEEDNLPGKKHLLKGEPQRQQRNTLPPRLQQQKKALQQKARRIRFLQYRGFGGDIIHQLVR